MSNTEKRYRNKIIIIITIIFQSYRTHLIAYSLPHLYSITYVQLYFRTHAQA